MHYYVWLLYGILTSGGLKASRKASHRVCYIAALLKVSIILTSPQPHPANMISPTSVSIAIFLSVIWLVRRRRQLLCKLPPGPKGWPVIGNLLDMPPDYPWVAFSALGKKYGPLTYLNVVGSPILIVNSHRVALDLLEKRGQMYQGRPRSVMGELSGKKIYFKNSALMLKDRFSCRWRMGNIAGKVRWGAAASIPKNEQTSSIT